MFLETKLHALSSPQHWGDSPCSHGSTRWLKAPAGAGGKFLHLVTIKLHQDQDPLAQFLLGLQGLVPESSVRTQRRTSSLVTQREKEGKKARDGRRSMPSGGKANWNPELGGTLGCGLTQVDTLASFRQFLMGPVLGRRMHRACVCVSVQRVPVNTPLLQLFHPPGTPFPPFLKSFSPCLYLTES